MHQPAKLPSAGVASVTSPVTSVEDIREMAAKLCRDYLHGAWRRIQPHHMVLKKVSGGLSNLLYYCALPPDVETIKNEPSRVLLRVYGQVNGERALETLITESVIFTLLSESQKGPRLFGVFPGGRLEEYIPARPLKTRELADPNLSRLIAEKMVHIHQMDVPINKQPRWFWDTVERWLSTIEENLSNDHEQLYGAIKDKLKRLRLREELAWLRELLLSVESPVVFCHNDLQEGNILVREEVETFQETHMTDIPPSQAAPTPSPHDDVISDDVEKRDDEKATLPVFNTSSLSGESIVIIDFEYCAYNYRGFEFANHFNEWIYDYSNEQPPYFYHLPESDHATQQQKEHMIRCYLDELQSLANYKPRSRDTVEHILEETEAFILASHFFWGLWSVVNSISMEIEFDYWGYGESRFEAYFNHKQKLLHSKEEINETNPPSTATSSGQDC